MVDALTDAWTRIRDELAPTYNKNEIPMAPPPEGSSQEGTTFLQTLSAGGRREPQLEKKPYVLPVPWMHTSARQLTLHSRVKFSCLYADANIAVTKSGLIVQLREKNIVLFNLTGEVIRTFSVGIQFYLVAVDSRGLIWVCRKSYRYRPEIWCFTEEGKVVGVKKLQAKCMFIHLIAFRGDVLIVVEDFNYRGISFYSTTIFDNDELKMIGVIRNLGSVRDLKVCSRTGTIYFIFHNDVFEITSGCNFRIVIRITDDTDKRFVKRMEVTANGDLILLSCDVDGETSISLYTRVGNDGDLTKKAVDHFVCPTPAMTIFNLPNQQVALIDKNNHMLFLDV